MIRKGGSYSRHEHKKASTCWFVSYTQVVTKARGRKRMNFVWWTIQVAVGVIHLIVTIKYFAAHHPDQLESRHDSGSGQPRGPFVYYQYPLISFICGIFLSQRTSSGNDSKSPISGMFSETLIKKKNAQASIRVLTKRP